jgi:hypothetical protein
MKPRNKNNSRRRKPKRFHPSSHGYQLLEDRRMLAALRVTNANASGPGSLPQAIIDSNLIPGTDTISIGTFNTIRLTEQLTVTDSVSIFASSRGEIVGNTNSARIFDITSNVAEFNLHFATLSGGGSSSLNGGAIHSASPDTAITITDSVFTGNQGLRGGAIFAAGPISIVDSKIIDNQSVDEGGGIYALGNLTLTEKSVVANNLTTGNHGAGGGIFALGNLRLTNSTVSGNSTAGNFAPGGAIAAEDGAVILTNSTVSGNSTVGTDARGGAIAANGAAVALTNSTISGNRTVGTNAPGGGIFADNAVTLTNSTVAGNRAGGSGGGIAVSSLGGGAALTVHNSIVAGNLDNGTAPDFVTSGNATVRSSIIGDTTATTLVAGNNNQLNVDFATVLQTEVVDGIRVPLLTPDPTFNGGTVQTIALLSSSPAIDAGDDALAVDIDGNPLTFDQRGIRRFLDGAGSVETTVDIGAFEAPPHALMVDSTRDDSDGDFSAGQLTLREAIELTNARAEQDAIGFAATVSGSTIALTNGQLIVTDDLTITGPGAAEDLVIDAQRASRVLSATAEHINLTLEALTITNGLVTGESSGGGIQFEARKPSTLTLINSLVTGNTAGGNGGGVSAELGNVVLTNSTVAGNTTTGLNAHGGGIYKSSADLILNNSTVSGNSASGEGGGIFTSSGRVNVILNNSLISENTAANRGGGIASLLGNVFLTNSTVSRNTSGLDGGGIYTGNGDVILTNSTLSENTATGDTARGGGIMIENADLILTNSTVFGNTTQGDGGGIHARISNFADVRLTNSTISGNSADQKGGGISFEATGDRSELTIYNSIIAGNSGSDAAPDFEFLSSSGLLNVRNNIFGDSTGTTLTAGNNNQLGVDFTTVLETEMVGGVTAPLLTDNGGAVETIALLFDSPAVDAGDSALAVDVRGNPILTDQRGDGFDRVLGSNVDIGAFEFASSPLLLGDVDQNGVVNFLDIAPFVEVLSSNSFQLEADVNQDATVNFLDISPFIDLLSPQRSLTTAQFFAAATAPPEPSPLALVGDRQVQDEDDASHFQSSTPVLNSVSTVMQSSDEETDSRAQQNRFFTSDRQVSSLLGASEELDTTPRSVDLSEPQPKSLGEIQDVQLDEIFAGMLIK